LQLTSCTTVIVFDDDDVNDAVDNFIAELDATAKYYNLSGVRDDINKKLKTITTVSLEHIPWLI